MTSLYRARINEAKAQRLMREADLALTKAQIERATEEKSLAQAAQEVARKAARVVQDDLASKLSGIVTKALRAVFSDNVEFVAEFVERRGVSECDLYVTVNGRRRDILKGEGGGLADIVSICLQLAYILLLPDVSPTFIADEPLRHLDREAQERFAQVLRALTKEFGFTFILATHADPITEVADVIFQVSKPGDYSIVKRSER